MTKSGNLNSITQTYEELTATVTEAMSRINSVCEFYNSLEPRQFCNPQTTPLEWYQRLASTGGEEQLRSIRNNMEQCCKQNQPYNLESLHTLAQMIVTMAQACHKMSNEDLANGKYSMYDQAAFCYLMKRQARRARHLIRVGLYRMLRQHYEIVPLESLRQRCDEIWRAELSDCAIQLDPSTGALYKSVACDYLHNIGLKAWTICLRIFQLNELAAEDYISMDPGDILTNQFRDFLEDSFRDLLNCIPPQDNPSTMLSTEEVKNVHQKIFETCFDGWAIKYTQRSNDLLVMTERKAIVVPGSIVRKMRVYELQGTVVYWLGIRFLRLTRRVVPKLRNWQSDSTAFDRALESAVRQAFSPHYTPLASAELEYLLASQIAERKSFDEIVQNFTVLVQAKYEQLLKAQVGERKSLDPIVKQFAKLMSQNKNNANAAAKEIIKDIYDRATVLSGELLDYHIVAEYYSLREIWRYLDMNLRDHPLEVFLHLFLTGGVDPFYPDTAELITQYRFAKFGDSEIDPIITDRKAECEY